MTWLWIIVVTAVVGLGGALLWLRDLHGRATVLRAEVATLTSTSAALKAAWGRLASVPSPDAGVRVDTT